MSKLSFNLNDVKFTSETYYIGRNGKGRQLGLGFTTGSDAVILKPINSRGNLANCQINIPMEDIPKVIETLQALVKPQPMDKLKILVHIEDGRVDTIATQVPFEAVIIDKDQQNH